MARFARSPLVVLSACETGLSSLSLTSDYVGLTGSFLQMGARGVIGSRWAVYDDAALAFMDHLYSSLADGTKTERAVVAAQSAMRPASGAEDWAAFSYLGLPELQPAEELRAR
jgi:CHAT domain-containing protein